MITTADIKHLAFDYICIKSESSKKLVNTYVVLSPQNLMADILCPHCEEEIFLDDDASGEFVCPHCDGEFEWNIEPLVEHKHAISQEYSESIGSSGKIMKIISTGLFGSFFLSGIVMIVVSIVGLGLCVGVWESISSDTPSEAAGAGVIIVMGALLIGFLLSIGIGLSGLGILIIGLINLKSIKANR